MHGIISNSAAIVSLVLLLVCASNTEAQDTYDLTLIQNNVSSYTQLYTPSVQGSFALAGEGYIDSDTGQFVNVPLTSPITQITFGICTNFPFDPSTLQFSVGLDSYVSLTPLSNITVQNSGSFFSGTSSPIYLVSGNISSSIIPQGGSHNLDIVDEVPSLPIGLSFLSGPNDTFPFDVDVIAVPEPKSFVLSLIALIIFSFCRQALSIQAVAPRNRLHY